MDELDNQISWYLEQIKQESDPDNKIKLITRRDELKRERASYIKTFDKYSPDG